MFKLDFLIRPGGLVVMALAVSFVAGCATPEPGSPEAAYEKEKKKEEAKIEATKETVEELPDWYLNLPRSDHAVYAAGTATSPDVQLAMDKSELSAKRSLADRINSALSSKIKEFVAEVGQGENTTVVTEAERVTTNLITEVNVAGYSRKNSKILAQGRQYRAYVLLEYPIGKANRLLVDQIKKNRVLESKLRASKAFKELEEDIKQARKKK